MYDFIIDEKIDDLLKRLKILKEDLDLYNKELNYYDELIDGNES